MSYPPRPPRTTAVHEYGALVLGVLIMLACWVSAVAQHGLSAGAWWALVVIAGIVALVWSTGLHRCTQHRR